jgi:hypothetical protein
MKYQETLAQRELVIEDLPKSQQKKIAELEKLVSKIEEIEADVDDESREEFEAIKSQANQADEEIQGFIEKFDVEKAREQRARLAEMRSRIKKPVESVPNAPKVESTPVQSTPTPAPVSVPEPVSAPVAHTAPVQDNEQSIAAHIEELKKEAQISPDDFGNEEQEQEPIQSYPQEALEVEAEEEFEKQGERKPRKVNIPLVVMGVGALLLTWGAVNFFKERR